MPVGPQLRDLSSWPQRSRTCAKVIQGCAWDAQEEVPSIYNHMQHNHGNCCDSITAKIDGDIFPTTNPSHVPNMPPTHHRAPEFYQSWRKVLVMEGLHLKCDSKGNLVLASCIVLEGNPRARAVDSHCTHYKKK